MDQRDQAPMRTRLRTSDPEQAREILDGMYGTDLVVGAVDASDFRVAMDVTSAGGVTIAQIEYRGELRFDIEGRDEFTIGSIYSGTGEHERHARRFGPGDVYIAIAPELHEACRTDRSHSRAVQIPAALLSQVASSDPDAPAEPLRFLSRDAEPGAQVRWNGVVRAVEQLLGDSRYVPGRLVLNAAARLLAATALEVFPNTSVVRPTSADVHDAHPDTVARAIAFIEADPSMDMTVADIARAAYVSVRALQLAFRRHLDTTPLAYLRRVRLSHAHDDLLDATSGDGTTIARIAYKWGFSTPSRFVAAYRAAYGQMPRHTLRGERPPEDAPDAD